jgi:NADH-quinone oxidoreductase subunit L
LAPHHPHSLIGFWQFLQMLARPEEERAAITTVYEWLAVPAAGFKVDFALQLDQLSISFVLLITFVGTLIHIYSLGYMSHDENPRRFFAYLNLFVAAMLLLVLADNYSTSLCWLGGRWFSFIFVNWVLAT